MLPCSISGLGHLISEKRRALFIICTKYEANFENQFDHKVVYLETRSALCLQNPLRPRAKTDIQEQIPLLVAAEKTSEHVISDILS